MFISFLLLQSFYILEFLLDLISSFFREFLHIFRNLRRILSDTIQTSGEETGEYLCIEQQLPYIFWISYNNAQCIWSNYTNFLYLYWVYCRMFRKKYLYRSIKIGLQRTLQNMVVGVCLLGGGHFPLFSKNCKPFGYICYIKHLRNTNWTRSSQMIFNLS